MAFVTIAMEQRITFPIFQDLRVLILQLSCQLHTAMPPEVKEENHTVKKNMRSLINAKDSNLSMVCCG